VTTQNTLRKEKAPFYDRVSWFDSAQNLAVAGFTGLRHQQLSHLVYHRATDFAKSGIPGATNCTQTTIESGTTGRIAASADHSGHTKPYLIQ